MAQRGVRVVRGTAARLLVSCAVVSAVFGGAGCRTSGGSAPSGGAAAAAPSGRSVRVETVARADVELVLVYGAELRPSSEVRLFSTLMDRIESFPWDDGDEIEKGQVVALVRKDGLDRGMEQVAAEIQSLDVQIRNLQSEVTRARDLLERAVGTQQAYDAARTNLDAARARRKALVAGRGQLAATAENAVIAAPISGVLADRMLEEGDIASPQVPLGRLMVVDPLDVELQLMEADIGRVRLGQDVTLELDAYPGRTFAGTVTRIRPYVSPATRTNAAEVTVPNPRDPLTGQRLLKPGMYGRARLVVDRREDVVVAPEAALLLDSRLLAQGEPGEERRRAFVVGPDGRAQERVVLLGRRDGTRFEVVEGLTEGDQLVVRGHHGLRDQDPVEVQGAEPAAPAAPAAPAPAEPAPEAPAPAEPAPEAPAPAEPAPEAPAPPEPAPEARP
jgi:membrane fusion protein (multidrug efflux system)